MKNEKFIMHKLSKRGSEMNKKLKTFIANGKRYPHTSRHKANSRMVCFDLFKESFKKKWNRDLTREQSILFKTGFNMGFEQARERYKIKEVLNLEGKKQKGEDLI
jgi:hypothetical protein